MQRKMRVILNRITGENVTVLLRRYHAPYLLSPMDADPYRFGLPYKVRSPWLPLPRNAISLHRKQPLGVTTVSSSPKTRNVKNALQMPHTLYKNNGFARQAASEDLFEIHSQMVVAPNDISRISIALL